jgi:tol-pal system protein YbgF
MRFITTFFAFTLFALPAFAQNNDMRAVMSRMEQMQRQMDTISKQVYSGNPPPEAMSGKSTPSENAGLAAAMDERMSGIEGTLRQINNRLDEQDYAIGQLKQDFDLFKSDLEVRLKEMGAPRQEQAGVTPLQPNDPPREQGTPQENDRPSSDRAGSSGPVPAGAVQDLPTDNAASLYDAAFQALREQKYDRAEAGFRDFITRYGSDPLAGNAQYWLGETFYVRGKYDDAAKIFAQAYKKYPKSSKAPDNLLKLGLSLSQTGKKQEACVTLAQLGKQFPSAAPVIKQRSDDEMKKLNCGM